MRDLQLLTFVGVAEKVERQVEHNGSLFGREHGLESVCVALWISVYLICHGKSSPC
jgi:hypothetical protein